MRGPVNVELWNGRGFMENKKVFRWVKAVLLLIMVICLVQVGRAYALSVGHKRERDSLRDSLGEEKMSEEQRAEEEASEVHKILKKYVKLSTVNQDLAGWITIEGTNIDYPVMQCEDDEYYLSHNFYGEEDRYGCLYVRERADVNTPGTNFIIYGHNMKDGAMLGDLDKYESEEFCANHSMILFDTLYEKRTYEIIAAFRTRLYEEDEEFKYYQFYQADTEEEFASFYDNIKKISLYDTGVTAEFGDTFLTLSTCDYYAENGRFVVVAKLL